MLLKNILFCAIALASSSTAQSCKGQSCDNAAWSGSSGAPCPPDVPSGGNAAGNRCIATYPGTCPFPDSKRDLGFSTSARRGLKFPRRRNEKRACKAYTLLFARGTAEPGAMGISVGPALRSALQSANFNKWDISGIDYDASISGDYCLGLPGGVVATKDITEAIEDCPDSLIFVSGYSEGGMVVRNGIANLDDSIKDRVAVRKPCSLSHCVLLASTNYYYVGCCHIWRSIQWRSY
jgi:Cutinase